MRIRVILAAGLAVAGAGLLAAPASAAGAPTSGWWSRLATTSPTDEAPAALPVPAPSAPGTVPVGATVSDGQLLVEGTPEGATAVAAVRWTLDDGESGPSLTLPVGAGSTLTPQSIVLACKAAAPWSAPESGAGTWDTKPLVDASRCVNGVVAADASTVSFGLQPLVSGTTLDIVLTPGRDQRVAAPAGAPEPPVEVDHSSFRWVLDAPTGDSLASVAGSGFEQGADHQFVAPAPAATDPGVGGSTFAAPPPPALVDATLPAGVSPTPAAAPALEPQDLAPSVPDVHDLVPAVVATGPVDRRIGFGLLLLAALLAAWAYLVPDTGGLIGSGRFRSGAAVALGASDDETMGGLGRFRRTRSSPPTPLS